MGRRKLAQFAFSDVTELRGLLEINRLTFEKGNTPMAMTSSTSIIIKWNECAVKHFGWTVEDAIGGSKL